MIIALNLSPNHSRKKRLFKDIKFVIIHYTGMQSEIASINRLKNPKFKVSCHYLINRKGRVMRMVEDSRIAWHAGKSKWKDFQNLNNFSIGIELVNKGHNYGYQTYTSNQIKNLIKLCKILKKKYSIKKENFLGHSDIAPLRKMDPGEKFPWEKLSKFNGRFKGALFFSFLIKSIETFSIRIGLSDNSGIIVPLKDFISETRKDVPIEQEIKDIRSTESTKVFLNDLEYFLPILKVYFLI